MVILSFCGKISSGKTASANLAYRAMKEAYIEGGLIGIMHLPSIEDCMKNRVTFSNLIRVDKRSFAQPVRRGLEAMFDLPPQALYEDKDRMISNYSLKNTITNRDLMINFAEGMRSWFGYSVFAQMMSRRIEKLNGNKNIELLLIDDLRKDVEFDMLAGFDDSYTVWVEKDGNTNHYDGEIDREECDHDITWETPEELESAVRDMLKSLDLIKR